MELHNSAIQGFFDIPVDHLFCKASFYKVLSSLKGKDLVIVSPDAGGVERARALAKVLETGIAIVDKRRSAPNKSEVMHVVGDVAGKRCLIVDDMVDTAGSLVRAASALKDMGAQDIMASITHPVLSAHSVQKIAASDLSCLWVSDSIPLGKEALMCKKIKTISVAPLIAEAIRRIHDRDSISSLFL